MSEHPSFPSTEPLVSVIVPAYNAERTLDATLLSVRAQTHSNLEIFVVDDGSVDRTVEIAERHASEDTRIRVLKKPNGGVAEARNFALPFISGRFVAPVDADDLWAPAKIARQVDAIQRAGDDCTLAYCWFAIIDDADSVLVLKRNDMPSGNALQEMCLRNLVGNGSGALMRTDILREIGGFDVRLKRMGAQGSEDWKLYLQFAERGRFAVAGEFLVGYRESPGNMSRNLMVQLKSHDIVADEFASRHPSMKPFLDKGRTILIRFMIARCMRERNFSMVLKLLGLSLRQSVSGTLGNMAYLFRRAVSRRRDTRSHADDGIIGMDYMSFMRSRSKDRKEANERFA